MRHFQLPGVLFATALLALVAQSLVLGQVAIVIYAIVAIVRRINSRTTFAFALLILTSVVIMLAINRTNVLAGHFAIYAFLLLLIGTVSMGLELSRGRA
jgi:hypothetical protein